MKKIRIAILAVGIFITMIVVVKNIKPPDLSVEKNGDVIFVGEKDKISTNLEDASSSVKQIQKIDQAHEHIRKGDLLSKHGKFSEAAEEYKSAYLIKDAGSNAVSGSLLVDVYEKLGRYNDGINIIDDMIQNGYLSKNGVREVTEIRVRLTASKESAESS